MRGTWQTTDGGGGGAGLAVLALIAAAVLAVPVLTALARVLEVLAVVLGAVAVLAVLAGAGAVVYRLRRGPAPAPRGRPGHIRVTHLPPAAGPAEPLPAPRREAIGAPRPEVHVHFHGVTAEEVAAIIARQNGGDHG